MWAWRGAHSTRPRRGQGTDPAPLDVDTPSSWPGTTATSGGQRRVRFVAGGCVPGPSPWPASGRSWTTLVWRCSIRGSRSSTSAATGSPVGAGVYADLVDHRVPVPGRSSVAPPIPSLLVTNRNHPMRPGTDCPLPTPTVPGPKPTARGDDTRHCERRDRVLSMSELRVHRFAYLTESVWAASKDLGQVLMG